MPKPLDTTTINVADARGNLFSASPSSACPARKAPANDAEPDDRAA
jgi:hypothetical protein